jgi:1,4-dihydroxy-2-naphthoate polyprenyltransferase
LHLFTRVPRLDLKDWQSLRWPVRWLVMSRAVVLIMTIAAVLVGILLASQAHDVDVVLCTVLLFGLTLAHASNNLINDWVDYRQGIDRENYFRRRYGAHVLEDNLVTTKEFWWVTSLTGISAIACGLYVVTQTGLVSLYLAVAGAFFVLFYTWPLKHLALGELSVLLVWGPLITGGSYYVIAGSMSIEVILVSIISGIGPTHVILGKHMDKYVDDSEKGISSLPVVIGLTASRNLTIVLLLIQWLLTCLLVLVSSAWWLLACLLTLPAAVSLFRKLRAEAPLSKPAGYPDDVWPLWYAAFAFRYCSFFGITMIAGLVFNRLF